MGLGGYGRGSEGGSANISRFEKMGREGEWDVRGLARSDLDFGLPSEWA